MGFILSWLGIKPAVLAGIALAIAAAAIGVLAVQSANRKAQIVALTAERGRLEGELKRSVDVANRNAAAVFATAEAGSRALHAAWAAERDTRALLASIEPVEKEVIRVIRDKPAQCAMPAGLRVALDGVRAARAAGAHGQRDPARGAAPAGAAAGMPAGPGTAPGR